MQLIDIHDQNGIVTNQLEIDDEFLTSDGRVIKGKKCYYKGIGNPYTHQYLYGELTDDYELLEQSDVFYMGNSVRKKCFIGKSGIFQERYQPQFTDFINTCGVKELSIIEHSMLFKKSSVDVLKAVNYDKENHQYYFKLNYKCGRKKYLDGGFPKQLKKLIEYMIQENWNFVWDKNTITDISYNGLVTDVADIFHSKEIVNKFGTVYSILYSLGTFKFKQYLDLIKEFRLKHNDLSDYIFNTIAILKMNSIDVSDFMPYNNSTANYQHVVLNYLVNGRNCGHCVIAGEGERIKDEYIKSTEKAFKGVGNCGI